MLNSYTDRKNTGLATSFTLENGKFKLTGGTEKVDDSMLFMLRFFLWFRLMVPDFVPNVHWILQKNTSVINRFKNVLRLQVQRAFTRNCPWAEIKGVDMPIDMRDRKKIYLDIDYKYKLDKESAVRPVRFIIST